MDKKKAPGIKSFTDFKELFKLPSENSSSEKQITTK